MFRLTTNKQQQVIFNTIKHERLYSLIFLQGRDKFIKEIISLKLKKKTTYKRENFSKKLYA